MCNTRSAVTTKICIIEVGHKPNTPAIWVDAKQPSLTLCDVHRKQYDERDDLGIFDWQEII